MRFGRLRRASESLPDGEEPIRAELFGVERLEQHAESLATAQRVTADPRRGRPLLPRVADDGRVLLAAYRLLAETIREERAITPAAEWLVDNFHVVDEQLREIREDLPPGFYRQLPKLADGFLKGYPRVFGLAWAFVSHTDSRFEAEALRRFVQAYQRVQTLRIGELWAIAITLRLVMVENLRRIAEQIIEGRASRHEADQLADCLLELGGRTPVEAAPVLARFQGRRLPMAFAVQLSQRLREQDPDNVPALRWLDDRLKAQGTTTEELAGLEHQRQASMNVTVRNLITSMRLMSMFDWKDFFESVSRVDAVLAAHTNMTALDFPTRDVYRHVIEELARGSGVDEVEVARHVVACTQHDAEDGDPQAARHHDPGYYLVSRGRPVLERAIGYRRSLSQRLRLGRPGAALPAYLASVAVLSALILAIPMLVAAHWGLTSLAIGGLALLAFVPVAEVAITLTNLGVVDRVRPRRLAKLLLAEGVPREARTLLVIPALLTSDAEVVALVEQLEIHALASSDAEMRFALLSDWTDAETEEAAGDDVLLAAAVEGIAALNRRYGPASDGGARFTLLHRRRRWNSPERKWMGWERKRGKLHELNRLLRGATDTNFLGVAEQGVPSGIRYVITLDADTRLPVGAARALIGTMMHPLNHAHYSPRAGRVVEGYGVLQPRVTPMLPGEREGSVYQWMSAGPGGIEPYAAAASDLYQDLFGEGSYTGKGIYDVDAFEQALGNRVPENAMLSHDLFEGTFARAGLASDISFFEEFPTDYEEAALRAHRWARGDWQLLPWIVGRRADGMPLLGQWKIVDNLRRTLLAPMALATLGAAWTAPPVVAATWTKFILLVLAMPPLIPVLTQLVPARSGVSKRSHARAVAIDLGRSLTQIIVAVIMLAHQGWLMLDAIVRTLTRVYLTHRRLLEWVTAAQATSRLGLRRSLVHWRMVPAVVIALAAAALVAGLRPANLPIAVPFVVLWALSPAVARWISLRPRVVPKHVVTPGQERILRLTARRTWRFFETFVGAEDHALPPDNFQEDPKPVVAHRTSPTNIGLYLLSTVAARDSGWIGLGEMLDRIEATFDTLGRLERFHGHFYNWYETRTLAPLEPVYVSSVDSGNFVGHLLVLEQACDELAVAASRAGPIGSGVDDALWLVRESALALPDDRHTQTVTARQLHDAVDAMGAALSSYDLGASSLDGLDRCARTLVDVAVTLDVERGDAAAAEVVVWSQAVAACVASHRRDETGLDPVERLRSVARSARRIFDETEFGFLLDPTRNLLTIGYRAREGDPDPNCYDLLASEARLASFVAIAKGDVPVTHWFQLGRAMTPVDRGSALISWSGSMFEYLMPALVMRAPPGSLLHQTGQLVVRRQMRYGARRGVPWGVSEAAFNARDLELTYQYANFGVPGLGLQRGLSEDVVIAPYATALAAMIDPAAAVANFERLTAIGMRGRFGFYESIDYTAERRSEGAPAGIVRAFMAHHQGMSIVAIANVLHGGVMRRRFHAAPIVKATELLLQERAPRDVAVARPRAEEVKAGLHVRDVVGPVPRRFLSPHDAVPRSHLLSNGRYAVMITAAGSGYSRCGDLAITRWREDVTRDAQGQYVFLRDVHSGRVWSAGYQPSGVEPDSYEAVFSEDRAEIHRRDGSVATTLEVVVSPEDDAEVRRVTVSNLGRRTREIEITSYAEVVLAPPAADAAHPVFSNLFVQTEARMDVNAVLATRRPRSPEEPRVWAAQVVAVAGEMVGGVQYETDRGRFLGRGRGIRTPTAVIDGRLLSNTAGAVLDPIFSLRVRVRLPAGAGAHITFSTVVAHDHDAIIDLADRFRDAATFDRVVTLARTRAQVQLHHLGIAHDEANLFQRLANRVLYADPSLRPAPELLRRAGGSQASLWAHGISGDLPIVLVRIDDAGDQDIVRQLLRAHEYWRLKQLAVDLVILNEQGASYAQELQGAVEALVRSSQSTRGEPAHQPHGSVYILRGDRLLPADGVTLQNVARAVLLSRHGTLAEQVNRVEHGEVAAAPVPVRVPRVTAATGEPPPLPQLEFFNGLGGFAADGREYVTILGQGQWTPAPWINVVANPDFGFQVSESGSGYTWSVNSRENQLTAWSNDPVSDPSGETFYVRDEDTGEMWGPTVHPMRDDTAPYVARHGQGYSRFEHTSHGIALDLLQLVPLADPIKLSRLVLENRSARTRRLSVTVYVEWVLGVSRGGSAPHVITEVDTATGAMLARNPWNGEFAERVAFVDLAGRQTSWTADRTEFIGRNGTLDHPAALERRRALSGRVGAGLDPCAVLRTTVELPPRGRATVVAVLGQAASVEAAAALVRRYRDVDVGTVLAEVAQHWDDVLGGVTVTTPDRSMDVMLNRWLLYQTLACRVWARSAFYQAGGAYGFRDQLQDMAALTGPCQALVREHLLRAAGRQFVQGDVQHWWHPPGGRGTRTRISDDLVWLPWAMLHYLEVTNDASVLDEIVPFLDGPALGATQAEAYFEPQASAQRATVFEHCARTLDRSLDVGAHGLPLIGTGDWNDGMNRVGQGGAGESVWLGWFLHTTLSKFARVAEQRGEHERAAVWRRHVDALKVALERDGWDGDWYRRAYYDDGTPLGSAANTECRIDSIAQSWGVLSGAADPNRAARAMAAVEEHLLRRGDGVLLLFTPPFDRPVHDPGYIQGYLPGVRENGGQYTHAAAWAVLAFAALGDGDRAGELFSILNPINHASTRSGVHRYKVEPYVVAADVYAEPPHAGRGGWTWYTGSAGWMYRAGLEGILGLRVRGARLEFDPCIPRAWARYDIAFRYHSARYTIGVENPHGVTRGVIRITVDDVVLAGTTGIDLVDDATTHRVIVTLG